MNDGVAIDLMDSLERRGLRVPEDVSVAGFDDVPLAVAQPHPPDDGAPGRGGDGHARRRAACSRPSTTDATSSSASCCAAS